MFYRFIKKTAMNKLAKKSNTYVRKGQFCHLLTCLCMARRFRARSPQGSWGRSSRRRTQRCRRTWTGWLRGSSLEYVRNDLTNDDSEQKNQDIFKTELHIMVSK